MNRQFLSLVLTAVGFFVLGTIVSLRAPSENELLLQNTWEGFRRHFISAQGAVIRPQNKDVVSEGQAYAMLRAVWMNDQETFDKVYSWTDLHLSRQEKHGDYLLAWRWKDDTVDDWMPATDADMDYALSLILAHRRWQEPSIETLPRYVERAHAVLDDILIHETVRFDQGKLYLTPWILTDKEKSGPLPINPSYLSPAHFKVFAEFSGNDTWLDLKKTAYAVLEELSIEFNNIEGIGLFPDWCLLNADGSLTSLPGKSEHFGWDAVRVPIKLYWDLLWFDDVRAKKLLSKMGEEFVKPRWQQNGRIFAEQSYDGSPVSPYENPLFYTAYWAAAKVSDSELADALLHKIRASVDRKEAGWVYIDSSAYYVNSLCWMPEGFKARIIRQLN